MSSFNFGSHMQTFVQTQKIDQLEQEVHELRGEVTTLRAEVEKLTSLVSSLMVTKDQPFSPQRPQTPCHQAPQPLTSQDQAQRASQFNPVPIKYAILLPILLKRNLVQTRSLPRVPNPLPPWYRTDLTCVFHQGAAGHDTEWCYPLRDEVQKLIENNVLSFEDPDIQVLLQQQSLTSHPVAAVMPITSAIQNSAYQPQFQPYQQQTRQQVPQKLNPQNQALKTRYDPNPIKYAKLLPILLEKNLVQTKAPPRVPIKLPVWYRSDLSCEFHQGALGHDVEHCYALKNTVQDLVEANTFSFKDLDPDMRS